jgi:hypothetical protein
MVAALTMNYMRATRKEANPVEATMEHGSKIQARIALGNTRQYLGCCLWSRPSHAFLGAIPRRVPV